MNVIHMKYAVEVAKAGSINKASETLLVAQPNLSRSIKELEADLGITIFLRTSKGMILTPKGEEFLGSPCKLHRRRVLKIHKLYRQGLGGDLLSGNQLQQRHQKYFGAQLSSGDHPLRLAF